MVAIAFPRDVSGRNPSQELYRPVVGFAAVLPGIWTRVSNVVFWYLGSLRAFAVAFKNPPQRHE
jgi:hypothetical protein